MKKKTKKLMLNRETLTQLEQPDLQQVAGAITARPPCYSGYQTCGTCNLTCNTVEC
jgi:hypothetical protein